MPCDPKHIVFLTESLSAEDVPAVHAKRSVPVDDRSGSTGSGSSAAGPLFSDKGAGEPADPFAQLQADHDQLQERYEDLEEEYEDLREEVEEASLIQVARAVANDMGLTLGWFGI